MAARAYASAVIQAPRPSVWSVVRDFAGIGRWYPPARRCVIEGGLPAATIGAVREVEFDGGACIRERLTALSDVECRFSYEVIAGLSGFSRYVSTVVLRPVTVGEATLIEWLAEFDGLAPPEAAAACTGIEGAFRLGFETLAAVVAARPGP